MVGRKGKASKPKESTAVQNRITVMLAYMINEYILVKHAVSGLTQSVF
jgi:hypothetical protein